MGRTLNAKKNMIAGAAYKAIELGTPFITRTILLYFLGADYLGLSSLFASILQVLNLAELGFSRAIIFSLFKPLALEDTLSVNALLNYYRRVYKIVGTVIFTAGFAVMPFLPKLIKGEYPADINLFVLFFLYLLNTSASYWLFAYKNALITASQRQDIISNISTILGVVKFAFQVIVLVIFKNYYAFVILNILFTVINNCLVSASCKRIYPQYFCDGTIDQETKQNLSKQMKGIAIGKFSQAARNSFDSIVLSMFCGLIELTIYSNYFYILTAVTGILGIIIESISSSIGDSIATESVEKNYNDFKKFNFYYAWLSGWFAVCLFCLYQPFMELWVGKKLCASMETVILFSMYFYLLHMGQIRAIYASAAGIWWELRWISIGEMISNVLLNFFLGYYFGMRGILVATLVTVFIFSIVGVSIITFKKYFRKSPTNYFVSIALYFVVTVMVSYITMHTISLIRFAGIVGLILKGLACITVPNLLFFLFSQFSEKDRGYLKDAIKLMKK